MPPPRSTIVPMAELIAVWTEEEIRSRLNVLAQQISRDYAGREIVLVCVLKGAFVFLADLARRLAPEVRIDFVRLASYGSETSSSGEVRISKPLEMDIRHRDVLVVEDIVDSGLTLKFLLDYLMSQGPRSVRVCALIDKCERREVTVSIDYSGFKVEKGFLVGYGLDYDEKYRNLPGIYALKF